MKLLHIITGLSAGGAERALSNLLAGGLDERFECQVISLMGVGHYGPQLQRKGVAVHALGMSRSLPGWRTIRGLRQVVEEFRPDVIQGWMYHGNLAASLARGLSPRHPALAWNIRQSLYDLAREKFMTRQVIRVGRVLSPRADAIIYNSRLSREQHERFGFHAGLAHLIPNGFDLMHWRPDPAIRVATRTALSIPADARVVGHVARFHPMKDHVNFLRAAVQVAQQFSDVRFLLVGRNVNLGNPLLAGTVPSELRPRFYFLGERTDIPDLMGAMDVFCQSSWSEAFPNVLGEAMACGVPCVTTDVGDSADIVADTGIVVPPSDSRALAHGLLKMMGKSQGERESLGLSARHRVERHYGVDAVVAQYAGLYERLMDRRQCE